MGTKSKDHLVVNYAWEFTISFLTGYCMAQIKIKPGDPTDINKKNRFFPFEPSDHVSPDNPGSNKWYWDLSKNAGEKVRFDHQVTLGLRSHSTITRALGPGLLLSCLEFLWKWCHQRSDSIGPVIQIIIIVFSRIKRPDNLLHFYQNSFSNILSNLNPSTWVLYNSLVDYQNF